MKAGKTLGIVSGILFALLLCSCADKKQATSGPTDTKGITSEQTASPIETLSDITKLYESFKANGDPHVLLDIALKCQAMKVTLQQFQRVAEFGTVCHLRIVKSENFGDFVAYDGYHFKKILEDFPDSDLVDDAEYHLIFVLPEEYNYTDLAEEKKKLEVFLAAHPDSNLREKATKRLTILDEYLKQGAQSILD